MDKSRIDKLLIMYYNIGHPFIFVKGALWKIIAHNKIKKKFTTADIATTLSFQI